MCLKPKYIHFVYSFVAYVAFSSYLHREDQFVIVVTFLLLLLFFFHEKHSDMPLFMVNDPFSDLPFCLVVKNPYNLRSQIRFEFSQKTEPIVSRLKQMLRFSWKLKTSHPLPPI